MFGVQSFGNSPRQERVGQNEPVPMLSPYMTATSSYNIAKFDLSVFFDDSQVQLRGSFNFALSIFQESTIRQYLKTYIEILRQFSRLSYDQNSLNRLSVADLKYLNSDERTEVLEFRNKTNHEYIKDRTIHSLFEEQVMKMPEQIALVCEGRSLSYREVNEKANQLAFYLKNNFAIKPDTLIALCLDRSEYLVIAILGVLKAGGAYVPLEPSYPAERIQFIIKDTATEIVLTNEVYTEKLKQFVQSEESSLQTVMAIDGASFDKTFLSQSSENPNSETGSNHLAYVIYTSGTTGNPKGVLQTHANVVRLFTATEKWYCFTQDDVWTLFHSCVFDFTVWELWGALIYGGRLVVPTYEQTRDFNLFYDLCRNEKVTVLNQTLILPVCQYCY